METVPKYFKARDRLSLSRLSNQCKSLQLRSQVNWRFANWRVAIMPRSCISADVSLPSR